MRRVMLRPFGEKDGQVESPNQDLLRSRRQRCLKRIFARDQVAASLHHPHIVNSDTAHNGIVYPRDRICRRNGRRNFQNARRSGDYRKS